MLVAIRDWVAIYDEPPARSDWDPASARRMGDEARARRWEDGAWPWFTSAVREFGSWNAAIEAAGFQPRAPGGGGGNAQRRRNPRAKAVA